MGYGGSTSMPIGQPWLAARYYVPGANPHRDGIGGTPADPPQLVNRFVLGSPATPQQDQAIVGAINYTVMRTQLELVHNAMHAFVAMGGVHISFRDPFVFLLHSNVDRLFALWQTQPGAPERLDPNLVYSPESADPELNGNIEPWSTGRSVDTFGIQHLTRPWYAPENEGVPKTYKDPSIVTPPAYDTNVVVSGGTGEFYNSDGQGGITLLRNHRGWRRDWSLIVPGRFGGSGYTDLLFYEPSTGIGEFYTTDGQGGITLQRNHQGWRRDWSLIVPGQFGGNSYTDLLFYEP
jgi:hypothetical protein